MEQPAVVLALVIAGALLLTVEALPYLPTFGLAAAIGIGFGVLAVMGINETDAPWWPLVLIGAAKMSWLLMILRGKATLVQQGLTSTVFAAGGVGFAIATHDVAAGAVAIAATAAIGTLFPRIMVRTRRLIERPALVGMDAHVGERVAVVQWDGSRGTVRMGGTLWNARSEQALAPGADVVVTGYEGMTLHVSSPAQPIPAA